MRFPPRTMHDPASACILPVCRTAYNCCAGFVLTAQWALSHCPERVSGASFETHPSTMEQKMAESIDTWRDLLINKKAFAHVATLMADGTPQSTPVWIDYVNG